MFDPTTATLIRAAPQLSGLNMERLPERLSSAFAKIVAARLQLHSVQGESSQEWEDVVGEVRRLAITNEALVSVAPDRENRSAAAFVAATAHQLLYSARSVRGAQVGPSYLRAQGISSDVSAMLLFLVAEATADAGEVADRIRPDGSNQVENTVIVALGNLARGRLSAIVETKVPVVAVVEQANDADTAVAALYVAIFKGLKELASRLLGTEGAEDGYPVESFQHIKSLCTAGNSDALDGWAGAPVGSFSGPFHLASLLIGVASDLMVSALVVTPSPSGIDDSKWHASLRRIAKRRPYLWRNHRYAIEQGYLQPGNSAAVGFPTGAGKSTLAELKINAVLLAERKVIFLAPTLALVDQTARGLRQTFPTSRVGRERADEFGFVTGADELPDIRVMTPEACLTQMSFDPSVFENVGLLIFDECHLIHPRDGASDRRSIDAMLCVLNFSQLVPDADLLLLSAMMKNTEDIADWLLALTGRPCLSLSLAWKPTRQLRGSIVYQRKRTEDLAKLLAVKKRASKTKGVPAAVKRELSAIPFAFFSLKQTWETQNSADYALVKLLDKAPLLGVNKFWKITPNSGEVSSAIAAAAASIGVKTLVFFQTIRNATSASKRIATRLGARSVKVTDAEKAWVSTATVELGGRNHLYLKVDKDEVDVATAVHHGLLIPEERHLCESLYRREDGISVLTATSTLAQGMNLPSELVIIAEDSRFDEVTNSREILKAQELLNAAGRAGRAGESANGLVLVIPGKVVAIDLEDKKIGIHWSALQSIFGQSDQCLEISDPLTALLDRIHGEIDETGDIERYCIGRLAAFGLEPDEEIESRLNNAISRSFGAYIARKRNDESWLNTRIEAAIGFYNGQLNENVSSSAVQQIASVFGFPVELVEALATSLAKSSPPGDATVMHWCQWLFNWMRQHPEFFDHAFRNQNLASLFGAKFKSLVEPTDRAEFALPKLQELVELWMAGKPLRELELALGTPETKLKTCDGARKFVLRISPEIAYIFGLPHILQDRAKTDETDADSISPVVVQLGRCGRMGFDQLEKLALYSQLGSRQISRVELHDYFETIVPYLLSPNIGETWEQILERVEAASADELNNRSI